MTEKMERWKKYRPLRIILWIGFVMAFVSVIALIRSGYIWPVEPVMPGNADIKLRKFDDGWHIKWAGTEFADKYKIEVIKDNSRGVRIYYGESENCEHILPLDMPENSYICLKITPQKKYSLLNLKGNIVEGEPVERVFRLRESEQSVPEWYIDADQKKLTVRCIGTYSGIYHLFHREENGLLQEISSLQYMSVDGYGRGYGEMVIEFGNDRDFRIPKRDETITFLIMMERVEGDVSIWEEMTDSKSVSRKDFLTGDLTVTVDPLGNNKYGLSFTETAGDGYCVQRCDDVNNWYTVAELNSDDERYYETDYLPSGTEVHFLVSSINDGDSPWYSKEVVIITEYTPIYSTVWPVKELALYDSPQMTNVIGKAPVGKALCVTGEDKGLFKVYMPEQDAYIDSTYCMIDLTDYLGGMCSYDITNSYYSLYMAHDHEIYGISGTIIPGYENVLLDDGSFLVPLLYPVAKRLAKVAEATLEDGYRIKIYDSFRPYIATRYIYDTTLALLDTEAPEEQMNRLSLQEYLRITHYDIEESDETEAEGDDIQTGDVGNTYRQLMTNATYGLNYFLAKAGSMHNLGLALDLTLEKKGNAEELKMQSNMHDLSYNSVLSLNNGEAKLLQTYMYDSGFAGIASEWWHYQDNDARSKYNPPSVNAGVSVEGWKKDSKGVRYREADGSYKNGVIETIGDTEYKFNPDGYVIETTD